MKNKLLNGLMLLSIILVTIQCKKGDSVPMIPNESSYLLDFSYFKHLDERSILQDPQKKNWKFALQNLGIWDVIKNVNLKIPLTALNRAHQTTPSYCSDLGWVWKMDFNDQGSNYQTKLVASSQRGSVTWKLYVTNQESFDEFLWLTGTSSKNSSEGTWNFKLNPQNPRAYISIDWKKNNKSFNLKYKNVLDGSSEKNSFIAYKNQVGEDFESSYQVFDQSKNNSVEIRWNNNSEEGQIKDPQHFSDFQYHCWDKVRNDLNCNFNNNLSVNNTLPHHKNTSTVR